MTIKEVKAVIQRFIETDQSDLLIVRDVYKRQAIHLAWLRPLRHRDILQARAG